MILVNASVATPRYHEAEIVASPNRLRMFASIPFRRVTARDSPCLFMLSFVLVANRNDRFPLREDSHKLSAQYVACH